MTTESTLTAETIWQILDKIHDPEIAVISIVELGLIRGISIDRNEVTIELAPTFMGCPALEVIQSEIRNRLCECGIEKIAIKLTFQPPWSSNWITPRGRIKLLDYGLSPPPYHTGDIESAFIMPAACPHCGSENTEITNDFGPTLCRALYVCRNCHQPFERFKPI